MNRTFAVLSLFFACASSVVALPSAGAVDITIDTVAVGNAGNADDPADGNEFADGIQNFGSVAYDFRIGTTEVTNAQYTAFLNAKAASDPLGLYNIRMLKIAKGISRSGEDGVYSYATIADKGQMPVSFVGWYDAIRFANWLHNGQGNGDTETGAYTLGALGSGGVPTDGLSIVRNPGARWFLPSENEWYKAAYHQNDGVTGNYFAFPTGSDTPPTGEAPPGDSNSANILAINGVPGKLTPVGAYAGTTSPYGAFDMAGNVIEWNEGFNRQHTHRANRGGSFYHEWAYSVSNYRNTSEPTAERDNFGFRVASISSLCGDSDLDSDLDSADLLKMLGNWTGALDADLGSQSWANGDCDGDHDIDSADLAAILASWTGAQASSSRYVTLASVPEPTFTALSALIPLCLSSNRRRRRATPASPTKSLGGTSH